jgi:hypothetical protein
LEVATYKNSGSQGRIRFHRPYKRIGLTPELEDQLYVKKSLRVIGVSGLLVKLVGIGCVTFPVVGGIETVQLSGVS